MMNKSTGDQNRRSVKDWLSPPRSLRQAVAEIEHLVTGPVKFCSLVRVLIKQAGALVEIHCCLRKAGVLFCTSFILSLKILFKKRTFACLWLSLLQLMSLHSVPGLLRLLSGVK